MFSFFAFCGGTYAGGSFFLMLFCWSFFSSFFDTEESEKGTTNQTDDSKAYVKIMLYLMCEIVLADKNKMVCELDAIKDFIRKNDPNKYDEHLKYVKEILKDGSISYDIKAQYYQTIRDKYSIKERSTLQEYLFIVAYADGECSVSEKYVLRSVNFNFFYNLSLEQREILFEKDRVKYENLSKKRYNSKGSFNGSSSSTDSNSQTQKPVLSAELQKAYAALGITEDATESQIKARWRNLMRVNHPDKVATRGADAVASATLKCQDINKAFEKIKASRGMK